MAYRKLTRPVESMPARFGPITQVAYVTRDFRASLDFKIRCMGVGPWFVQERAIHTHNYRGEAVQFSMSVGLANSGGLQLEIMEQHDDAPTIYSAAMQRSFVRDVQHHICMWPEAYDEKLADALAHGYRAEQDGGNHRGRFIYLSHPAHPEHMIEFTEATPGRRAFNGAIAAAAQNWDGRDPIRTFADAQAAAEAAS